MNVLIVFGITLTWVAVTTVCWLGWQLLRQNGRMLLRFEELEQRLNELEFGEAGDEPLDESHGRARHSVRADLESGASGAQGTDAPYPDDRASRFNHRSLAHSRIKREGLKAGTPAPDFRLPRLDGRGELLLEELRGRRVLLVFSDPHCGPCNALAPELEKFHRENLLWRSRNEMKRNQSPVAAQPNHKGLGELSPLHQIEAAADGDRPRSDEIAVVMISRGEPKDNRAKVKKYELTFPIVLQSQWEISRRYAMFATPIAYLIDEAGVISHDVAVGVEALAALLTNENTPQSLPVRCG